MVFISSESTSNFQTENHFPNMSTHPPLMTMDVELMPCSTIMLWAAIEGVLSFLFFFMPEYWLKKLGYTSVTSGVGGASTFPMDKGMFQIVSLLLLTRSMLYFYGGRCVSNTTAQGSVVQRWIVGGGMFLCILLGSLPNGMSALAAFNVRLFVLFYICIFMLFVLVVVVLVVLVGLVVLVVLVVES